MCSIVLDSVRNFAKSPVSTGYDASAVSIDLETGYGAKFPDPATDGAFNVVWWDASLYSDQQMTPM